MRHLPKGVSWDKKTSAFAWWGGQVRVPSGFTYQMDQGADTFEGHFSAPDGKLIIRHDSAGMLARGRAPKTHPPSKNGSSKWHASGRHAATGQMAEEDVRLWLLLLSRTGGVPISSYMHPELRTPN